MISVTSLSIAAYTGIVAIVIYLIVHATMFDWYKSKFGLAMNLTLVATALIGFGSVSRSVLENENIGRYISVFGWIALIVILLFRIHLLVKSYIEVKKNDKDIEK